MDRSSKDFRLTAGLLALAFLVGGAGLSYPVLQLLLGGAALIVAVMFVRSRRAQPPGPLDRFALGLLAVMLVLPLLQLVPLPPALWRQLPGRDFPIEVDAALGWSAWRPWTLDVERTIRSWLVIIPAAVVFVGCLRLPSRERRRLLWLAVGFALFNALLGLVQLISGGGFTPYQSAHAGFPVGLFVNRNHSAMLFLAAMPLAAFLGAAEAKRGRPRSATTALTLSVLIILTILVIGTTSRMALALLPLALLAALFILFLGQSWWRVALPGTLALSAVAVALFFFGGFNRSLGRFSELHDARFDYWSDLSWALNKYGLAGTGIGTFVPVHQSAESLSALTPAFINHAHNDYLELLLEGGLPAMLLIAAFALLIGAGAYRLMRSRPSAEQAVAAVAAASSMLLMLAFSVVDYPLRMPALSCLFALLCALLLPVARKARNGGPGTAGSKQFAAPTQAVRFPWPAVGIAALAAVGLIMASAALSKRALLADDEGAALEMAPWSLVAHERAATSDLLAGRRSEAKSQAERALRLSPLSAPALRTLAVLRLIDGDERGAYRFFELAAALGWRDPMTQMWAIAAAERSGEPDKAVMRAEALFAQHMLAPPVLNLLLGASSNDRVRALLAADLSRQPEWRGQFMSVASTLPEPALGQFERLLAMLGRSPAPATMAEVQPLIDRHLAAGDTRGAQRIWSMAHSARLLLNGDFEKVASREGVDVPADWDISTRDLRGVTIGRPGFPTPVNRALRLFDTPASAPILSQRLMLPPGVYRLDFRAHTSVATGAQLRWELRCQGVNQAQSSDFSLRDTPGWEAFAGEFTVPNQNCPIQRLSLERTGDMQPHEMWLDDVIFRPR